MVPSKTNESFKLKTSVCPLTEIEVKVRAAVTATTQESVKFPSSVLTVIVTLPDFLAVTTPLLETLAIVELLEDQETFYLSHYLVKLSHIKFLSIR